MRTSPNPVLVRFDPNEAPSIKRRAEWTSKQAKLLFEAGVETERNGSWSDHAVHGNIQVAYEPIDRACSIYGTSEGAARDTVEMEIHSLRARADKLEQILKAYGPQDFIERPRGVRAPTYPFDMEMFLISILRSHWTHIWINGREFIRDVSGSVVEVKK